MLDRVFLRLAAGSARLRRSLFRALFEWLARHSTEAEHWTQMNYGYADAAGNAPLPPLHATEEAERYCHALYHRVAGAVDLAGRDVVEVSCGRGGGSAFLARHHHPRSVTGIDIASAAVRFCRRTHRLPGLRFLAGDAEALPLADSSADAVVNIEASFCYGDFDRFLAEVRRVLRPGGYFLFADLRFSTEIEALLHALRRSGLVLEQSEDITEGVLRALAADSARRQSEIDRLAPWFARRAMQTFGGTEGSRIPLLLAEGRLRYLRFALRRPDAAAPAAPAAASEPPPDVAAAPPSPATAEPALAARGAR